MAAKKSRKVKGTTVSLFEQSIVVLGRSMWFKQPVPEKNFDYLCEALREMYQMGREAKACEIKKVFKEVLDIS